MRLGPSPATVFVGREVELTRLRGALDKAALVTLWGAAGLGKTRLAQRLVEVEGNALFVDLTEATDLIGICEAVARAMSLSLTGRGASDVTDEIGRALDARGRLLLVLDNYEQVAAHAKATLGRWMQKARVARFLVTSRELLDLPGEAAFALEPLSLPAQGKPLADSEALQLFIARATAVRGEYKPEGAELTAVRDVVQQLEGIPLAIELAASRMGVLSAATLRDRLKDRLSVLASQGKYATARQATLRGAIDWSFQLLDPFEKRPSPSCRCFAAAFRRRALKKW